MKIYSKIVGIILTLAGIGALIAVIVGIFDSNYVEEKVVIGLLIFPCLIFLHYMYIHNFGLNLKSEIPKKNYRIVLVLTILSLIISLSVPFGYLLSQINLESKAQEMVDRGKDESARNGLLADLKTKYEDREMLYILNVVAPKKTEFDANFETFFIEFKDKDGFKIRTIEIEDVTNLLDGEKKYGITSNSKMWISLDDYLKIADWNLLYSIK